MSESLRVAYTLEQCWHRVPGGTAAAALHIASELEALPEVELVAVAGRHRRHPSPPYRPLISVRSLSLARPWLYETWNRFERPKVEEATGPIDVCHSTTAIPAATSAPHVVTVHDAAFVHHPERFSRHGVRVMSAGLERARSAELVMCPTRYVVDDLLELRFDEERLRVVPWGVVQGVAEQAEIDRVRAAYDLPSQFVLFVGTLEPRKNLDRLDAAVGRLDAALPLVVVGATGWGETGVTANPDCRFLGFVPEADMAPLYAAASVFAYPSLEEGFGLPVLEAMAQATPVVTSAGVATEEVAGGAAVLVDPSDVESIAEGLRSALDDPERWSLLGSARAAACTWSAAAAATVAVYREVVR